MCAQFAAAAGPGAHLIDSPQPLAALRRVVARRDRSRAREQTTRFLELAAERGEGVGYAWLRLNLCEIELRAGEWDAAERLLDEWADSDDGQFLITPTYQRCRALLAAGRGDPAAAREWAEPALEEASRRGYTWQILESHRALGIAALLAADPATAAEHLRFVYDHCEREGVDEPGAFPVAADLLEALAELGADDEAVSSARRLAASQDHPWAQATLARADGEAEARRRPTSSSACASTPPAPASPTAAPRAARASGARHATRWKPRRPPSTPSARPAGPSRPARSSPASAVASPRTDAGELTQTERQVAELAASGQTNKEIALSLFVTTHTVEAHLSSVYAKLGPALADRARRAPVGTPRGQTSLVPAGPGRPRRRGLRRAAGAGHGEALRTGHTSCVLASLRSARGTLRYVPVLPVCKHGAGMSPRSCGTGCRALRYAPVLPGRGAGRWVCRVLQGREWGAEVCPRCPAGTGGLRPGFRDIAGSWRPYGRPGVLPNPLSPCPVVGRRVCLARRRGGSARCWALC